LFSALPILKVNKVDWGCVFIQKLLRDPMKKDMRNMTLSAFLVGATILSASHSALASTPVTYPTGPGAGSVSYPPVTIEQKTNDVNPASKVITMPEPSADFSEYLIKEYGGSDWKNHWLYSKQPPKGPWLDHLAAIGAVVDVDSSLLSPRQQDALTDYVFRFHPRIQFMSVTDVGTVLLFCDTQADCEADNQIAILNPTLNFVVIPTWVPTYPNSSQPAPSPKTSAFPAPQISKAPVVAPKGQVKKKPQKKQTPKG
jgi:hypothetical protein